MEAFLVPDSFREVVGATSDTRKNGLADDAALPKLRSAPSGCFRELSGGTSLVTSLVGSKSSLPGLEVFSTGFGLTGDLMTVPETTRPGALFSESADGLFSLYCGAVSISAFWGS